MLVPCAGEDGAPLRNRCPPTGRSNLPILVFQYSTIGIGEQAYGPHGVELHSAQLVNYQAVTETGQTRPGSSRSMASHSEPEQEPTGF